MHWWNVKPEFTYSIVHSLSLSFYHCLNTTEIKIYHSAIQCLFSQFLDNDSCVVVETAVCTHFSVTIVHRSCQIQHTSNGVVSSRWGNKMRLSFSTLFTASLYHICSLRTDFSSNLLHGFAFGTPKVYMIAPYGKINNLLI